MKHLKIYEKYEIDDGGDISEETAKEIISHYLDNLNDGDTLQDSFDYFCEELEDENLRMSVYDDIQHIIDSRLSNYKRLEYSDDYYFKKDAKRYNL